MVEKKNQPPTQEQIQGKIPRTLYCPRCERDFETEALLSAHITRQHPDYENPYTEQD
jgi:hypothetical protein